MHHGFIYLMFSRDHGVTKLGRSSAPHARLSQTKKDRRDYSIELVAHWGVWAVGEFGSIEMVEGFFHLRMAELCVKHPTQSGLGEWYETYWPNLAGYVESMGAMLAPLGIEMRRGQLVNPKW